MSELIYWYFWKGPDLNKECYQHLHKKQDFSNNVLWRDESKVLLFGHSLKMIFTKTKHCNSKKKKKDHIPKIKSKTCLKSVLKKKDKVRIASHKLQTNIQATCHNGTGSDHTHRLKQTSSTLLLGSYIPADFSPCLWLSSNHEDWSRCVSGIKSDSDSWFWNQWDSIPRIDYLNKYHWSLLFSILFQLLFFF